MTGCSQGGLMDCEYVGSCEFFRKFHKRKSVVWKGMIKQYCEDGADCTRREMFNAGQAPAVADLMPVGVHASKAFLSLP